MENQEQVKKDRRGGRRPGAGRPKGRKEYKTISIRIPDDVEAILSNIDNRSAYIIEAIREYASRH